MPDATRNPLRGPAYEKVINIILDAVEKNDGQIPNERTLKGLTTDEVRRIRQAFWANHVQELDATSLKVYPRRIVRDLHDDDPEHALETWYSATNRKRKNLKRERDEAYARVMRALGEEESGPRTLIREDLRARKGWISRLVDREGPQAAIAQVRDFLTTLEHLPLPTPTKLRVFSAAHLPNSKSLDPGTILYRRVTDFLLDANPELVDDAIDTSEARRLALERNNIIENPASVGVLVHGDITLVAEGERDESASTRSRRGIATFLTLQQLDAYHVETPARVILTIENETPFYDLAAARPPNVVLVCTRGQPNTAVRALLRALARGTKTFRHWGDIDAGGFRILRSVQSVAPATALLMDQAALADSKDQLVELDDAKRGTIEQELARRPEPTLDAVIKTGAWLEQESIPLLRVIEALAIQS